MSTLRETLAEVSAAPSGVTTRRLRALVKQAEAELRVVDAKLDAALTVTDEMVEKACEELFTDWADFDPDGQRDWREDIKATLVAALAGGAR